MVKGIDNAFYHMELCFVLSGEEVKMGMFFQEVTSIAEFPGRTYRYQQFKQVANGANLLLATVVLNPAENTGIELLGQVENVIPFLPFVLLILEM